MSSRSESSLAWRVVSSSATSISRSSPTRLSSSICRSSSSSGFSKSRVYVLAIRLPHLDEADRVRAEEIPQGKHYVFAGLHPEPARSQPGALTVPVGPLNIDRRRARIAGADRRRRAQHLAARPPRSAPPEQDAHRPRAAQLRQRTGAFHHEGGTLLVPVPGAVASGEEHRRILHQHLVEPGPALREDDRLGGAVKVFQNDTGIFLSRLFGELPLHPGHQDRKSTRLNSSHSQISYAVFCLKKKS